MANDRNECTAENPAKNDGRRWFHPKAEDKGTCSEGCCDRYHCPVCGLNWTDENGQ